MSTLKTTQFKKFTTPELLEKLQEHCLMRAETKTAKEKNKHADKIMAINAILRERGEPVLAEQMQFIETAAPVTQLWSIKNLWELYPDRSRQLLYRLTEHKGDVALSARFLLEEMG